MGKQGPCYHCGVTSEFLFLHFSIFILNIQELGSSFQKNKYCPESDLNHGIEENSYAEEE